MAEPATIHWHLQEWFASQGKIQRNLQTELGWHPAKAYKIWHGLQEPKLSEIAEIAAILHIHPNELLMKPEQAHALRQLQAAVRGVIQTPSAAPEPVDEKTGAKLSAG